MAVANVRLDVCRMGEGLTRVEFGVSQADTSWQKQLEDTTDDDDEEELDQVSKPFDFQLNLQILPMTEHTEVE
jgi:hypothetical protein